MRNVRVLNRTDTTISLETDSGVIRLPLTAIRTIDGEPAIPPAAPALPPDQASEPVAPEGELPTEATDEAQPSVNDLLESLPDNLNFELVLLAILAGGTLWMRSIQAVQKSLFKRLIEPRYWTLLALFLPGIGAGIYFLAAGKGPRSRKNDAASEGDGTPWQSGTGLKFPGHDAAPAAESAPAAASSILPAKAPAQPPPPRTSVSFIGADGYPVGHGGDRDLAAGLVLAGGLVEEAFASGGNQIHFEPTGEIYRVQVETGGTLQDGTTRSNADGRLLVAALKTAAGIDVAEKRRAQEGRLTVRFRDQDHNFHAATASTIFGEKVTLQFLAETGVSPTPGLPDEIMTLLQEAIHSRSGLVVVAGPAGATAFAIEQIREREPVVVAAGEIFDAESGQIATEAAMAGTLVVSAIEAADAVGAIIQLREWMERPKFAPVLLAVVAVRPVNALCPHCREEYAAQGDELESIGFSFEQGSALYRPRGCDACGGTGFAGQTSIAELLITDDQFRDAAASGANGETLASLAASTGFKSLRQDGAEKILLGITTVEDVLEATR